MTREICLVACSGAKIETAPGEKVEARDLYMASDLFAKSRAYAEARCGDDWAILSAKHGLLLPLRRIETYNATLNEMPATERRAWAEKTRKEIVKTFSSSPHFVVLAGERYRAAVVWLDAEFPLKGLGIGEQKAWLKKAVAVRR